MRAGLRRQNERTGLGRGQLGPWLETRSIGMTFLLLGLLTSGSNFLLPAASPALAGLPETNSPPKAAASRKVAVLGGQFTVDLYQFPVLGSPQAPEVIFALLDYTCQGCSILHTQLEEAAIMFTNQLAVVNLVTPLDGSCNPVVKEIFPEHTNACEYARWALTVWFTKRDSFPTFEKWLWNQPSMTPLAQTRLLATKLMPGLEEVPPQLTSRVNGLLEQTVAIYGVIHAQLGRHAMPMLLTRKNISLGSFRTSDELCGMLERDLGLTRKPIPTRDTNAPPR